MTCSQNACLGYPMKRGMTVGQFSQVAELVTGRPAVEFQRCGDALHNWIERFDAKEKEADGMKVSSSGGQGDYPQHPEGQYAAVCIGNRDRGEVDLGYGAKRMVELRFQLGDEHKRTDGRRFEVGASFTATLGNTAKPSNLRKTLELWRGRPFTVAEEIDFDLDNLAGVNCQLVIFHKAGKNGKTYANIRAILPPAKGEPKLEVVKYEAEKPLPDVPF